MASKTFSVLKLIRYWCQSPLRVSSDDRRNLPEGVLVPHFCALICGSGEVSRKRCKCKLNCSSKNAAKCTDLPKHQNPVLKHQYTKGSHVGGGGGGGAATASCHVPSRFSTAAFPSCAFMPVKVTTFLCFCRPCAYEGHAASHQHAAFRTCNASQSMRVQGTQAYVAVVSGHRPSLGRFNVTDIAPPFICAALELHPPRAPHRFCLFPC